MITLSSGLVVRQPLVETLLPAFEQTHGEAIAADFAPTSLILEQIAGGARPDLVLGVTASVRELADQGILDPDTVTEVAASSVGYARLPQTASPSDESAEAFLAYLLDGRSVAYSLSGASGLHFIGVLEGRGLRERVDEHAVRFTSGLTAEAVVDGRADVAIQQVSELRSVAGPQLVEPIPHELQSYARFAIGARPGAPAGAAAFIALLTTPTARDAFAAVGLTAPR